METRGKKLINQSRPAAMQRPRWSNIRAVPFQPNLSIASEKIRFVFCQGDRFPTWTEICSWWWIEILRFYLFKNRISPRLDESFGRFQSGTPNVWLKDSWTCARVLYQITILRSWKGLNAITRKKRVANNYLYIYIYTQIYFQYVFANILKWSKRKGHQNTMKCHPSDFVGFFALLVPQKVQFHTSRPDPESIGLLDVVYFFWLCQDGRWMILRIKEIVGRSIFYWHHCALWKMV